uniref:Suppressor of cytokine signaling 3a n=1 Tax=Oncorhynchus kisutch TaxID=8019 RepID=A0A8C7J4C7_ONCKI
MVTHSKFDSVMSSSPFDSTMRLPHRYKTFSSKVQYQLVVTTLHKLQESGFYWGSINGKEANAMLAAESVGTFLIRDSSDNRHFFTVTPGPFLLQTDPKSMQAVPRFDCVLKLVHHYMPRPKGLQLVEKNTRGGNASYTSTLEGRRFPWSSSKPFSSTMSSLQHLCRKTVNGHLDISKQTDQLPTPQRQHECSLRK